MTNKKKNTKHSQTHQQKFGKTLLHDIRHGDISRTLSQEFKDIYRFYIDHESRKRLAKMGRMRRWLKITWWILKSMFFKLTPVRRILFVVGIILLIGFSNNQNNQFIPGIVIIIIVLMLELKDKLLAHDELKVGRAVQISLMPKKSPLVTGWDVTFYTQPANDVGGDLIDYIEFDQNRWGFVIADVAGKGLGAALVSAKLQATIRAIANNFNSLAKLGQELNRIFYRDRIPERFVSLVYFEIKENIDEINIINAGHMPPIVIKKGKFKELNPMNAAIGIKPDVQFESQHIKLDAGDLFVTYSDGITEARNKSDEFFGEARLKTFLQSHFHLSSLQIGKLLLKEIRSFIGDERYSDDLSFIILKRN